MVKEKEIGKVLSYFTHVDVAALELKGKIKIGDKIHIKGNTTDFTQKIESMQIDRKDVREGKKGDNIGLKVSERVRPNDKVFLVG